MEMSIRANLSSPGLPSTTKTGPKSLTYENPPKHSDYPPSVPEAGGSAPRLVFLWLPVIPLKCAHPNVLAITVSRCVPDKNSSTHLYLWQLGSLPAWPHIHVYYCVYVIKPEAMWQPFRIFGEDSWKLGARHRTGGAPGPSLVKCGSVCFGSIVSKKKALWKHSSSRVEEP